ncbi:unnamed protein product, partial [Symbiodinium sp. CCMP2456]
ETITNASSLASLEKIGAAHAEQDATAQETLDFHLECLVRWLGALHELPDYHKSFPWRAIMALDDGKWPMVLKELESEWPFLLKLDQLPEKGQMHELLAFTRMQSINFDKDHDCAMRVRMTAASIAGVRSLDDPKTSLLNSLANELYFNDARDCQRRHRKSETSKAVNLCALAARTGWVRSPLEHVKIDHRDWCGMDEQVRHLKASILSSTRDRDRDVGISMHNLLHQKRLEVLTKPHVFVARLRLYQCLKETYLQDRTRKMDIQATVDAAWPCNILVPVTLWQPEEEDPENVRMVLQAGPWTTRFMQTRSIYAAGEVATYVLQSNPCQIRETLEFGMNSGRLSEAQAVVSQASGLAFQARKWMTPATFLCECSITKVKAGVLLQYCKSQGLNHAGNHRIRVKTVLEHHGYNAEYIEDVLATMP